MTVYLPETYRKDYEFYIADTDPTRVKDGITLLLKRHHIEARSRNLLSAAIIKRVITPKLFPISVP